MRGRTESALFFQRLRDTVCAVNRLSKAILIAFASLVAVAVLGFIGLNLYVQSPGTQARIQAELSRALSIPLEITNTTITPWTGLRITGIAVPGDDGNLLEANSFSARYRFWPLLRRKLVIHQMILESPRIIWAQNAQGKWKLPTLPERDATRPSSGFANEGDKPAKSAEKTRRKQKAERGFEVVLDGLEIRNGSIELLDDKQERLASISEVNMRYSFLGEERVEGTLTAGRLAWRQALFFTGVQSGFRSSGDEFTLTSLQATLAGGAVQGELTVKVGKKDAPFDLALAFEKVDLALLTSSAGWQPGQAAGALGGELKLHGPSRKLDHAEGEGRLTLADGYLRQLEFFENIGRVLQIAELSDLRIREGRAEFRVADEKTFIDKLVLDAGDVSFSAKGVARFDKKLSLDAQLAVSERLSRRLPSLLEDRFTAPDAQGRRAVAFEITGKTDHPKSNLLSHITGRQLGEQFTDLVSNLFGGPKKPKEEKKKKKDSDSKPAAPDPVPEEDKPADAATREP